MKLKTSLLLILTAAIFLASCGRGSSESTNPGDTARNHTILNSAQIFEPFDYRAFTPIAGTLAWQFEEESYRDGYSLTPNLFVETGVCVSTSFVLTTPDGVGTPTITIDGQPTPTVVRESENSFRVTPATPLSHNSLYTARISRPGQPDTTWVFQTMARFQITATLPAHQAVNVPTTTGIEINFSHGGHTPIADYFSIYPSAEGRFIYSGNTAIFMPTEPLEHGQVYTVTVRAGISLPGTREVLRYDHVFSFETAEAPDSRGRNENLSVHFMQGYVELPSFEPPQISFWLNYNSQTMLRPRINVRVYQFNTVSQAIEAVNRNERIPHWAQISQRSNLVNVSGLRNVASFNITQRQGEAWQEVMTLPRPLSPGFYVVDASVGDDHSQIILQITDIAVQVIADDEQALVWANDMATGLPLVGAEVIGQGREAVTNTNGLAVLPRNNVSADGMQLITVIAADGRETVVFFTEAGGGSGIMPTPREEIAWGGFWGSSVSPDDGYWTVLQLDRTLFQRSDTLYFWGFAQNRRDNSSPGHVTAVLTEGSWFWETGERTHLHRQTVPLQHGSYSGEMQLPHLDPGSYQIIIVHEDTVLGSMFFSVEDYVTPPYQMILSADRRAMFVGETVSFTVRGEFFEGTPVSELDVSYSFFGWQLQNNRQGSGATDRDGNLHVSVGEVRPTGDAQGQTDLTFFAEATLPEIGWTMQQSNIMVFINDIDVRANASRTGRNASLSVNVNDIVLDELNDDSTNSWNFLGDPVRGQDISVQIVRVFWVPTRTGERYDFVTREVVPVYRFDRREEVIDRFQLATDANGEASRDFQVPDVDRESYIARLTTTDGNGRRITHDIFIGRDWERFHWNAGDDRIFLDGARNWWQDGGYDIGEEVNLSIVRGDEVLTRGGFLFVVANQGILHHHVGQNPLSFTFEEKHVPGATVHAFFFDGHNYHSGWGMTEQLRFNTESRQLDVEVSLNQSAFRPGEEATVTIRTTDADGNPRSANVNVAVVDEALFALREYNVDTLADLYRSISTGIRVNLSTHGTFEGEGLWRFNTLADGVAPAAAAMEMSEDSAFGGGAQESHIREIFEDTAYFRSLRTNHNGVATFTFRLPDNITSWRLTASGVTNDFYAGNTVLNVPVSIPMFLHYTLGSTFLVGDFPQIGVNVYGTDLNGNEEINFEVWMDDCECCPQDERRALVLRATGAPFERVNIPLWEMTAEGPHSLSIRATSSTGKSDAVRHFFYVIDSHRTVDTAVFYEVTADTVFEPGSPGLTNITFTDKGRGQFLWELMGMRHVRGERIEGLLMRREANQMLREFFPSVNIHMTEDSFDPSLYQMADGGIAILPHASSDLAASVHLLPFIRDDINVHALRGYLRRIFETSATENRIQALYGLALLREPVLYDLRNYARLDNLSVRNAAYLALGFIALGERETAAGIYNEQILPQMQSIAPYYRINLGNNQRENIDATSAAALVAVQLGKPERTGLHRYTIRHHHSDLQTTIHRLSFISTEIRNVTNQPASITYTLFGDEFTQDLSYGMQFNLRIPTANLHEFNLTNVTGEVGAVSIHRIPLEETEPVENDIRIRRQFFRAGTNTPTNTFDHGDLVRVQITIDYSAVDLTGSYLVTDFLPAGLAHVPNSARFDGNRDRTQGWVWATVEGQRVMFFDHNSRFNNIRTYHYYARVISPGTFRAEGTIVQNLGARGYMTVGECAEVRIEG